MNAQRLGYLTGQIIAYVTLPLWIVPALVHRAYWVGKIARLEAELEQQYREINALLGE